MYVPWKSDHVIRNVSFDIKINNIVLDIYDNFEQNLAIKYFCDF